MATRQEGDLPIFVAWLDFLAWLLPTTAKLPKHIRFTFVDRMDNLALDVVEDLVEARYSRNKRPVLSRANLRLEKASGPATAVQLPWLLPQRPLRARDALGRRGGGDAGRLAPATGRAMKRHGHLFEEVTDYGNLLAAARRARRGKGDRTAVARFIFHLEPNLLALQKELRSGNYRMRPYRAFVIREPKRRQICAAHFRDRVVHHSVCAVLDPIFDGCLIHDTYACRRRKGTHAAVRRLQHFARRSPYVLMGDVRRFFETVDHEVLKALYRRKLKDRALLALLDRIVDHPLPGGSPGKGLPIGNLTSQYFANLYLGELDHFVKERLRLRGYLRYMDDFAVFADSKARLHAALAAIREFLAGTLRLELREERTRLAPATQGAPFLGFRVFPGVVRLDGRKLARLRRRLRGREAAYRAGAMEEDALARSVQSMIGHIAHVDSLEVRRRLFAASLELG